MEKIPTLFVRDISNMKLVTREVNPDAFWIIGSNAVATIKKDGTNVRITTIAGKLTCVEKRKNPSREEKLQGIEPAYVATDKNDPADKHILAAADGTDFSTWPDGSWSCEAIGAKIQGGVEGNDYRLYPFEFSAQVINEPIELTYDAIREFLVNNVIEGIVWHQKDDSGTRYAKIKRRDFGLPWPANK